MKKPSKKEIITCIQFFIMLYEMTWGFWHNYMWIWFKCGLPVDWWSVLGGMVLALLSVFGLCHWIWKEGKDNA